jgi:uncharacterized HhH-GPD family protein
VATKPDLHLSGDPAADKLISSNPFALLVGMVLDQQIPLEWAFTGPSLLAQRVPGKLEASTIAAMDPEALAAAFRTRPALHRFPASMAGRVQELAKLIVEEYGGDSAKIWKTAKSGEELRRRVEALPGFGKQKAKIFVALLGKQLGVQPPGWREESAPYSEEGSKLSIADIDSADTLALVREHKRQMKAAAKAAAAAKGGSAASQAAKAGRPGSKAGGSTGKAGGSTGKAGPAARKKAAARPVRTGTASAGRKRAATTA